MGNVHGGRWRERDGYERCEYCGSITPAEALRRMITPRCRFSGTDKGGYKFYFDSETGDHGKFYGEHLADLSETELVVWAATSRKVLGVDWTFRPGEPPGCRMPRTTGFFGWQVWGRVDDTGSPVFDDSSLTPPTEAWWQARK